MEEADAVLGLAATLLPGGAGFPPFRATGAGPVLLHRLPAHVAAGLHARLTAQGAPPTEPGSWTEVLLRLDAAEPALFTEIRKQAYLAYYEQPEVIAAIRALGHPYNDSPLPDGYPTDAFDPAVDAPRHSRGRWIGTDDIRPVDVAGLGLAGLR